MSRGEVLAGSGHSATQTGFILGLPPKELKSGSAGCGSRTSVEVLQGALAIALSNIKIRVARLLMLVDSDTHGIEDANPQELGATGTKREVIGVVEEGLPSILYPSDSGLGGVLPCQNDIQLPLELTRTGLKPEAYRSCIGSELFLRSLTVYKQGEADCTTEDLGLETQSQNEIVGFQLSLNHLHPSFGLYSIETIDRPNYLLNSITHAATHTSIPLATMRGGSSYDMELHLEGLSRIDLSRLRTSGVRSLPNSWQTPSSKKSSSSVSARGLQIGLLATLYLERTRRVRSLGG
ncbi:hypothetical protein OIU85_010093 [Salix viminalis]|uniref:Uncharacterized protein n=1 Tax=Salix viminalis TaxID=40686 RepID=A0A9Q0SGG0_SALVM|nr:hypothetical protein OIU85_010093 [Salix viminalis]